MVGSLRIVASHLERGQNPPIGAFEAAHTKLYLIIIAMLHVLLCLNGSVVAKYQFTLQVYMRQMNILIQVGAMLVVHPDNNGVCVCVCVCVAFETTEKTYILAFPGWLGASFIYSRFEETLSLTKYIGCAAKYSCTDIPTPARTQAGQTCADFNSDPNFTSGILSGSRQCNTNACGL